MKKTYLLVLVPFLVVALVSCACKKKDAASVNPGKIGEGARAPDFTLNDLKNAEFSMSSVNGKVVLLDFWATWCYPCRVEIPHFIELYDEYREEGLEVVGIALDKGGADVVRPFAQKEGINYTVVLGDTAVANAYGGIRAIPTTFIIDKKGIIHAKYVGVPKDIGVFEQTIKKLLGK